MNKENQDSYNTNSHENKKIWKIFFIIAMVLLAKANNNFSNALEVIGYSLEKNRKLGTHS